MPVSRRLYSSSRYMSYNCTVPIFQARGRKYVFCRQIITRRVLLVGPGAPPAKNGPSDDMDSVRVEDAREEKRTKKQIKKERKEEKWAEEETEQRWGRFKMRT